MSISSRVDRLTEQFGGKVNAHAEYVRDQALLAGWTGNGETSDSDSDLDEVRSHQHMRRKLVQYGGWSREQARHLGNAELQQTYFSNRGCLDNLCNCCLRVVEVEGDSTPAIMIARLIVKCFQQIPALGDCPPEIRALADGQERDVECHEDGAGR